MRRTLHFLKLVPVVALSAAILLAGCQLQLPDQSVIDMSQPSAPSQMDTEAPVEAPASEEPEAEESIAEESMAEESMAAEEPPVEESMAAEEPADEEPADEESADDVAEPEPAEESMDESAVEEPIAEESATEELATEESATDDTPSLTVTVASLRIRSGPGTEYDILGAATQGESFVITGQAFDCGWYQIDHPLLGTAWTSGSSDFVTSNVADCTQIPTASIPTTPTPAPTVAPVESAPAESAPAPESTVAPQEEPAPESEQASADQGSELPADQGCYLFQNQLGPELNVTITNADDGSSVDNFKVAPNEERPYCLWPGRYTITVDAPPPWADLNDTLTVNAGEHFLFPIRAR